MNVKTHIIYIVVIVILTILCVLSFSRPTKTIEVEKHSTDTLILTKVDTIVYTKYDYVEKKVIDTVYLSDNDKIDICDYRFSKKGAYDILASGYSVELKNVTIYPTTKEVTITNIVEKEIMTRRWELYAGIGIDFIGKEPLPSIRFAVKAPKNDFLIGADIGYYSNKPVLGVFVAYNLLNNNR